MKVFTVNSRKFDGKIHKTWKAKFLKKNENFILLIGSFQKDITHPHLNVIRRGTISYEFFWFKKWYSIFRFHEPDSTFKMFYCNINLPPTISDNTLDYIDLDIDIIVQKDMSYQILDLKEFQKNSQKFSYPQETIKKCYETLRELESMIKKRSFPFCELK